MAKPVTVTLSHDLGKEEVRRRIREGIDELLAGLAGKMGVKVEEEWVSDDNLVFIAKGLGQRLTGKIDIFPEHVRIEVLLPGLLAAAAEKVTAKLQKEGTLLLEKK